MPASLLSSCSFKSSLDKPSKSTSRSLPLRGRRKKGKVVQIIGGAPGEERWELRKTGHLHIPRSRSTRPKGMSVCKEYLISCATDVSDETRMPLAAVAHATASPSLAGLWWYCFQVVFASLVDGKSALRPTVLHQPALSGHPPGPTSTSFSQDVPR